MAGSFEVARIGRLVLVDVSFHQVLFRAGFDTVAAPKD
jgi:hypothetical protein